MEAISVIAEVISCNPLELIKPIVNSDRRLWDIRRAFERIQTAGYVA